jgi:glycosyltransferase involved in cell wall biosynthesis
MYKNIKDEMNRVLISNHYDIIQVEKIFMAPYVVDVKDSILIVDPWGIDFEGVYRLYRYEKNLIKKIRLYLSSLKIKVSEKKLIKKFDYVITVSLRDKSYYAEFLKNNKILLLPNCVDCDYFNPAIVDSKLFKNSLVFTGIMNYEPNIDAVIYFYNQIYPLIKKKVPSIKIFIAGKNPSEKLNFLRENSDFVITGYVEDIRQYLSSAEVCIIPMRMGGGTRFKVLEAMSMGKAVVSTSVGCEGIEADNNSNIIISDNPVEFADRTVYLLNNYDVIKKIGKNAREIILKKYNWGNIIKDYYEIINSRI